MKRDPDQQFLRMMTDHHKGLILMTRITKKKKSRRSAVADATKMDVKQSRELRRMRMTLREEFHDRYAPKVTAENRAMANKLKGKRGDDYDRAFYQNIIKHHRDGIKMIDRYTPRAGRAMIKNMAKKDEDRSKEGDRQVSEESGLTQTGDYPAGEIDESWPVGDLDARSVMTRRTAILRGAGALAATAFGSAVLGAVTSCSKSDRRLPGEILLDAREGRIDVGDRRTEGAWLYSGTLPGPELRITEGTRLRARFSNSLKAESSIHWHGIPQRGTNAMDGVPGVTQTPVKPGEDFLYDFVGEPAGTYLYHSHFGLQIEHGLYGALIIEPRQEAVAYDREYVLMFDDWPTDVPERMLTNLAAGRPPIPGMNAPMAGMAAGPLSADASSDAGMSGMSTSNVASVVAEVGPDVPYRTFLVNGKPPSDPPALTARRGDRIRLRLINAGAATGFRVALAGHKVLVTHADGAPVRPLLVDALEFAPGERYDVLVIADNPGAWELKASSVDEPDRAARAVLHYDGSSSSTVTPAPGPRKEDILLRYADLASIDGAPWISRPDRVIEIALRGQMVPYRWWMGDRPSPAPSLSVRAGELVQVRMRNESPMRHPMHLHGHSFRLRSGSAARGETLLKDTASVEPGATLEFQFRADNPGRWLFHCHHAYHQEVGMMRVVRYVYS